MLTKILDPSQDELLKEERRVLTRLQLALAGFDGGRAPVRPRPFDSAARCALPARRRRRVQRRQERLHQRARRRPVVQEGVTPDHRADQDPSVGEARRTVPRQGDARHHRARPPILREIHIVDTPGTNAIIREHEIITADFVPRSDLVLFVTSADRPFTETERVFLEQMRDWGKKIVVVINKIDILETEDDIQQVVAFVAESRGKLLGIGPEIFPVSARAALRAKEWRARAWAASRFEALERYIHDTLDEAGRVRLKLLNPLGVAPAWQNGTGRRASGSRCSRRICALDDVERQLGVYQRDRRAVRSSHGGDRQDPARAGAARPRVLRRDAPHRPSLRSLEPHPRAAGVRAGRRRRRAAADRTKGQRARGLMIESDFRQWQAITAHLADRRRRYRDRIIDDPESSGFHTGSHDGSSRRGGDDSVSSTRTTSRPRAAPWPTARGTPSPPRRRRVWAPSVSAPSSLWRRRRRPRM